MRISRQPAAPALLLVVGALSCEQAAPPPSSGVLVDRQASAKGAAVDALPAQLAADRVGSRERPAHLGEVAESPHFTMKFLNVKTCTVAEPFRPRHDQVKLGVEVELTGKSTLEVPVNPFYGSLETRDGVRYSSTLAGCDPVLAPVRLTAGHSARGWLTFDVPREPRALTLIYAPTLIGAGVQELRFEIR